MTENKFEEEIELQIVNRYEDGESSEFLAKEYNCHSTTILRLLDRYNVEKRTVVDYYAPCNEDYFENIDTEEKAYYLGLFYSDGNVSKDGNTSKIGLVEKDKYLLTRLGKLIYGDNYVDESISSYAREPHQNFCVVYLTRKKIREDLIKHGVVPCKWNKIRKPNISDELMRHFIRGFLDGDGGNYIIEGKPLSSFTSNPRFINDMAEYLKQKINIDTYVYKYDGRDTAYISITGFEKLNKYFDYLYKDATIYMQRKYDVFQQFLKLYEEHKENFKAKYNEENIVNLHLEGFSRQEISNTLNISYDNVGKKLRKNRIYN